MNISFDRFSKLGSGGFLTLKKLWDELDLSLALSRSGIVKRSGATPWALVFALIAGWFASKSSVNQTAEWAPTDDILTQIVGKVSQSALSRFLTRAFRLDLFNQERIRVLQDRPECRHTPKDVLALDDTKILHEHSKKIPFVTRLFDHVTKRYVRAQNIVALYAVTNERSGYALDARFWKPGESQPNKWQIGLQMLTQLVSLAPQVWGCFVAFDSWYLVRPFLLGLEERGFRFVTKAKSNTSFYELRPGKPPNDRSAYRKLTVKEVLHRLLGDSYRGTRKISSANLFIKVEDPNTKLAIYKRVQVVAVSGHRTHEESERHRTFLLISGDVEASAEAILHAYEARWRSKCSFGKSNRTWPLKRAILQVKTTRKHT